MNIDITLQKYLIQLVKNSIELALGLQTSPLTQPNDNVLTSHLGAFVTLKRDGQLRGCIGNMVGRRPLKESIADLAVQAAFHDPRFPALSKDEFEHLDIEISILSPLFVVPNEKALQMLEIGKHGILISNAYSSGVLLPQVAVEHNFTKEEFLEQTCKKAGLLPLSWKDPHTQIEYFTVTIITMN